MPKKSKKQRKKENLARIEQLQQIEKAKRIESQKTKYISCQESKEKKLEEIQKSELPEQEKLIQLLCILNPEKVKQEDLVAEDGDVLYYSKALNMQDFKKLRYPKGYTYEFSQYPRISFSLNGRRRSFIIRRLDTKNS